MTFPLAGLNPGPSNSHLMFLLFQGKMTLVHVRPSREWERDVRVNRRGARRLLSAEMEVIEPPSLAGPWLPASGWAS